MTVSAEIPTVSSVYPVIASHSRITKSMGNMVLSNGRVRIKFAQPQDRRRAGQQDIDGIAAEKQCRAYIAAQDNNQFTVNSDGSFPSPAIEVSFQRSLLEKLPLLTDVLGSTDSSNCNSSPIELPCSLWGLVSLLILLEGEISVDGWFRGKDNEAALPASTLMAADFMGCSQVKEEIIMWLHGVLQHVLTISQATSGSQSNGQACPDLARQYIRVLSIVPPSSGKAVFSIAATEAVSLPLPLFSQWVSSSTPIIDLSKVSLTAAQWSTLPAAVLQTPPNAVTEMHMAAEKVLGLHNIHLAGEVLSILESLLENLPPTLIELHITTHSFEPVSVQMKERFFRAVAQVHTLQELHMPEWARFVGTDAAFCTDPLMGVPGLRIVVPEVKKCDAFPAGLLFDAKK